jgi:transcriptional regulator with XRE-family HTH domain
MTIRRIAADNIRFLRQKKGLSQIQLAVDAGMSTSYIGYLERAEKSMTLDRLEKIAKALKVQPNELLIKDFYRGFKL